MLLESERYPPRSSPVEGKDDSDKRASYNCPDKRATVAVEYVSGNLLRRARAAPMMTTYLN